MLQDIELATRACSGLQTAFFQRPSGRQLQESALDGQAPVNILFLWCCSVLVFLMQAGFAMVSARLQQAEMPLLTFTALRALRSAVVCRISPSQEREEHLVEKHSRWLRSGSCVLLHRLRARVRNRL